MAKKTQTVASETKSPSKKTAWPKVGQMLLSQKGSYYVKFDQDVTIKAGETLMLRKPADEIASLVANGHLDQEKADERLAKIPDFVKFNVIKPPANDGNF